MSKENILVDWETRTRDLSPLQALKAVERAFGKKAVLTTSFGPEDQYITHLIATSGLELDIATLDTGRLFQETYDLFEKTRSRYDLNIRVFYPDCEKIENLVSKKGPNSFYESVNNRKECCYIRKVEPLQRCLKTKAVWITGIRAAQSEYRKDMPQWEYDAVNEVFKFHPLLHMTDEELEQEIEDKKIPVNELHAKGYPSIGCAPCTRAITEGEHPRAGRWWWESSEKECGLHKS